MTVAPAVPAAYRVRGPAATDGEWRRFAYLARTLAVTEWKLRFFGSVLGYFWSLLRPLLLFAILYVVFSLIVDVSAGVESYPVLLLLGVVIFTYFGEVTGGAVTSMVDRELLVRKVHFPRMVVPLSVALSSSFNLVLNLVTVAAFMAIAGVQPRWSWLLLPIPLILLVVFATGLAMLVSALYVPFRDVKPIWEVVLQGLFYATPVIYPIEALLARYDTAAHISMMNPLASLIQETRHLILGTGTPSAAEAIGGAPMLLIPGGIALGLTALGFFVFNRTAPHVAEQL